MADLTWRAALHPGLLMAAVYFAIAALGGSIAGTVMAVACAWMAGRLSTPERAP